MSCRFLPTLVCLALTATAGSLAASSSAPPPALPLPAAVSLIDIAPTIASAFGIELKDVDGRAVPALAGQAVVRAKSA